MTENNKNSKNEFFLSQWMEGTLTDTEFKTLVSKEDFLAYRKLKKGIEVFSALEKPLDNSFINIKNRIKNKPKVRTLNYKWLASIAAMFIFFLGFYTILGNDSILNSTGFGEQKTVALLDGSQVILNAKSSIKYSKKSWKNKREVYLNGEAFFKVKKGKTFTVKTKNGDITVLGTQFTVNSINGFFEVICFEGKVKVTKGNKSIVLNPTDSFREIENKQTKNSNHKEDAPTWILGESTYKSIPLKYVIADFEKQYHIKVEDTKIDNTLIFTGSFSHKNKTLALKTIFDAMQIKYKEIDKKVLVLEK